MTRISLFRCLPGACAALMLCAPAAARADAPTGGAQAPQPVSPAPVSGVVSVGAPLAVSAHADTLLGSVARFRGTARPRDAGRRVVVQRFDERRTRWIAVARTVVGPRGGFVARWRTDRSGRLRIRAVLRPRPVSEARRALRAATASAELGVTVYRAAFATWYGPGFFGNATACGVTLAPDTIGVAHRTLPCGTQVALLYRGRTLTVPVIDRGPFNGDASWDLTQATAQSLGMSASDTVGTVRLP